MLEQFIHLDFPRRKTSYCLCSVYSISPTRQIRKEVPIPERSRSSRHRRPNREVYASQFLYLCLVEEIPWDEFFFCAHSKNFALLLLFDCKGLCLAKNSPESRPDKTTGLWQSSNRFAAVASVTISAPQLGQVKGPSVQCIGLLLHFFFKAQGSVTGSRGIYRRISGHLRFFCFSSKAVTSSSVKILRQNGQ